MNIQSCYFTWSNNEISW